MESAHALCATPRDVFDPGNRKQWYSIPYTEYAMSAQLLKLEASPDLVDRVYHSLLDAISEGSLAPGQRITQEDIATQLEVSRQPVLQALRQLKKDGFVHDAPAGLAGSSKGKGIVVAPLDEQWTAKIYEVRGALDALAARLAAQQRFALPPALIARGRSAAKGKNIKAMIDADLAFHQAIYVASGNPLISQLTSHYWCHLRRVMGAVLQGSEQRSTVWEEHEAIATAIAAGKASEAAERMTQHAAQASQGVALRLAHVLSSVHVPTHPTARFSSRA